MHDNIKNFKNRYGSHPIFGQLRDIRSLGLVVFAIIVVLVSWSGVRAIEQNYRLEQQVSRARQENSLQKLRNDNQRLRNQYYSTPQYLELAARQNFGLALPGEKELIIPREVALAHVRGVHAVTAQADGNTSEAATATQPRSSQPFFVRNTQAWIDFFLHRSVQ